MSLAAARCAHHAAREAVARCPECARFYCRECVTEHDDRLVCARCLQRLAAARSASGMRLAGLRLAAQALLGFALAWGVFLCLGRVLLRIPAAVHEGSLWEAVGEDVE